MGNTWARICESFKEPRNRLQPGGPVRQPILTYRPARLHRLAEPIPWNRFLGSLNVYKYGLWKRKVGVVFVWDVITAPSRPGKLCKFWVVFFRHIDQESARNNSLRFSRSRASGWDLAECGWDLDEHGWNLAECGWDLADCGWDLAECGWDLAECGWDLAVCG